jgi:recombination associated protein RdgC
MWFKNLQLFRVPENWGLTAEDLAAQLEHHSFQPAGGFALESRGWIPPRGDDQLVYALSRQWLIALGVEQKLLPASVIRQTMKERAAELESKVAGSSGARSCAISRRTPSASCCRAPSAAIARPSPGSTRWPAGW